jgi:hypothetical protein
MELMGRRDISTQIAIFRSACARLTTDVANNHAGIAQAADSPVASRLGIPTLSASC